MHRRRVVIVVIAATAMGACGDSSSSAPTPTTSEASTSEWVRLPYDEAAFGSLESPAAYLVDASGANVVAAGWVEGTYEEQDAYVWSSTDGRTWSCADDVAAIFGGPGRQSFWDLTAGGPGFVLIGQ